MERGRNGDADLAIHDLTQAVSINPRDSGAYVNRAVAHMERNRPADLNIARNELTHAIELEPDSPIAYFNRGLVYSVWRTGTGLQMTCCAPMNSALTIRSSTTPSAGSWACNASLKKRCPTANWHWQPSRTARPETAEGWSTPSWAGTKRPSRTSRCSSRGWTVRPRRLAGALTVPPAWPGSTTWRLGETPSTPKPFDNFGSDQSLLQMTPAETVAILFKALRLD